MVRIRPIREVLYWQALTNSIDSDEKIRKVDRKSWQYTVRATEYLRDPPYFLVSEAN
jgi:hypothetical protein